MSPMKEPKDKADSAVCVDNIFGQKKSGKQQYALSEHQKLCGFQ